MKSSEPIIWQEDRLKTQLEELAKTVSPELKEGNWYKYSICFKKEKNGKVLVRSPQTQEL